MLDNGMTKPVLFSVIIATCNRPDLANRAIRSILSQTFDDYEIIVVNNGSSPNSIATYNRLLSDIVDKVVYLDLNNSFSVGLGPSISRNYGISQAKGKYIAFCDDDDEWLDPRYLSNIYEFLLKDNIEILFSNQQAISVSGDIKHSWFNQHKLMEYATRLNENSLFLVNLEFFYKHGGFPHLNNTIYLKKLIDDFGGFCNSLTYEEDFEMFFRLSGQAKHVVYYDKVISRHYIPNKDRSDNLTTAINSNYKSLSRIFIFNKLLIEGGNKELRAFAKRNGSYIARHVSIQALLDGNYSLASSMAQQNLGWSFGIKSMLFFSM